VFFISDRDGVANVWQYETTTKKLTQVTKFTDFDVKSMDSGAGAIVFEQAGYIHELNPKSGKESIVNINAVGDFPWMMPNWEDVSNRLPAWRYPQPANASSWKHAVRSLQFRRTR
jgi:tricorn protease